MNSKFVLILMVTCFLSCKKVGHVHPEMIGKWVSYQDGIEIGSDGRGTYSYFDSYFYDPNPKVKSWRIKNNTLIFGRLNPKYFSIIEYPTVSTSKYSYYTFTIDSGETYINLDNRKFKKVKS